MRRRRTLSIVGWATALATGLAACGAGAEGRKTPALALEAAIPLQDVKGRIDHMAVDLAGGRLFVAALGNGSIEVVDLKQGKVIDRLAGLSEPQGLGYLPPRGELVVASGDGTVRFYAGKPLKPADSIKVGNDADNVRVDAQGNIVVGYGGGGLAVIDPGARRVVANAPLPSHPEGFRLDPERPRAFVNLPGSGSLATVDLAAGKVSTSRKAAHAAGYPLQYDPATHRVLTVYRLPSRLTVTDGDTGASVADVDVCGDSDDLFLDSRRERIYVSCGSGEIDVLSDGPEGPKRIERIKTRDGARTSLFVPEIDRLFVAARASGGKPAAILVFRPND